MKTIKILIMAMTLFGFSALAALTQPAFAPVAVAKAAEDWPALKLKKPAKLHAAPSAPSAVIETVWKNNICIWLDKQDVWVKVRMKKDGHVGWIHQSYLAPAVTTATVAR